MFFFDSKSTLWPETFVGSDLLGLSKKDKSVIEPSDESSELEFKLLD